MKGFLNQVASHLFKIHDNNINKLTLVFPNRRGGVFFKNYLNNLVEVPIISPGTITINELFSELSDLHVPDRLSLIFRLYKVYCEFSESKEPFDDFYYWGEMLLADFDQVDKYLADANVLFTNVTDLKEIDEHFNGMNSDQKELFGNFWRTLSDTNKTPNQQEFIRLWKDLTEVYTKFKYSLHQEGLAYEGMLYREVVESKISGGHSAFEGKYFIFIGFNALNSCEEVLFDNLLENKRAEFYWDFDKYYLEDVTQEAGYFMRRNIVRFPQAAFIHENDSLKSLSKSMKIVNISSQVGQAQVAANELSQKPERDQDFDETAVILCDEELLLPVIGSLSEKIGKVNVTMGYPLKMTPVFSLIAQLIILQKNVRSEGERLFFYNNDVIQVLNHQLVIDFDPPLIKSLIDKILKDNIIYIEDTILNKNSFLQRFFYIPKDIAGLSDYFQEIIKVIFSHWQSVENENLNDELNLNSNPRQPKNSIIYSEYLYRSYLAVKRLKYILVNDGAKVFKSDNFISKESFFRFLSQYLSNVTIPFEGEPLEGLQIMGILETRALDFKNLIFLSMNEGIMPKISSSGSFIPYNLRRVFGLPTIEEQNAMYAYYFYRLLQRAENITFVYDSGVNGLFSGEKSRYLYQLQLESNFKIEELNIVFDLENSAIQAITIEKDAKVMTRLNDYLNTKKTLTPSAIDKYLTCQLQFYFRYSAGIFEPDEISEEVDSKIFGLLFHDAMEQIYKPFIGRKVISTDINKILNDQESISEIIKNSFNKVYFKGNQQIEEFSLTGRNWLIYEVVKKYINQLLIVDLKRTPFEINALEEKVNTSFTINNSEQTVTIGGTIDRLDLSGNIAYIFDYKTGKTDLNFSELQSLFDRNNKTRNKGAFQTLVYSYVLYKSRPGLTQIYPGIYSLRGIFEENFYPLLRSKESGNNVVEFISVSESFETLFRQLLEEIFNPLLPFVQTTNEENCKYCSYRQICRR